MSNLSIFKIGIGPSSSHTLGPILAANAFCKTLKEKKLFQETTQVNATLFGSLSLTGRGHLSDKALIWGLSGLNPKTINPSLQEEILKEVMENKTLKLGGERKISFIYEKNIHFCNEFLPLHENAMEFSALDEKGKILFKERYYSIGGGFIKTQEQMQNRNTTKTTQLKLQINNAKELIQEANKRRKNLAEISILYEKQFHTKEEIREYCMEIWEVMQESFYQGCHPKSLILPGPLHLHRRAKGLYERICPTTDPFGILDYISLYAIAIAEENAGGGRVVTAPTNGACAVIPSVMLYLKNHSVGFSDTLAVDFLLSAMMIGSLYKKNASISGAEAGCQAEIGSASSMAAAAMTTILGGNIQQACNAAEIAMEHHLGLTCDPAFGLVQIPCIERNAFGAIKAISAARMAMTRKSHPVVSLDNVIATMYQTGKDMNAKYKETALGGLAKTLSKSVC
ncbi:MULTISPECIES: L-serine ammonia-lyase [Helicobacter]|uniref:L-serine ammonia-lyase n=1 Tax=Helicobacter TaxID=209 RepID=UPI00202B4CA8|nr:MULTISPECIES: L-serine ammonia-lyase [Helicobacter]MCI7047452.1 L-serine ammonia-lyase [Helicobacter sp.]MCL9821672.1 L-serine ammonia-lyase [Helicobacter colisuis]